MTLPVAIKGTAPAQSSLRPALMADMARYGVRFDQDGIAPAPESKPEPKPEPKVDPALAAAAAAEKALRDELAALRKQQTELNATPAEIAELRKLKLEADKLKSDAVSAQAAADEAKLRKEGDFEALRLRMAEEHDRKLAESKTRTTELQDLVNKLNADVSVMALGAAFAASKFVGDETVFSASKAQKIYGDHFDIEAGSLVGYDKPRGAERRTKVVDARGEPLPFDDVMRRLVEADADRDQVLRASQKPGSGVPDRGGKAPPPAKPGPTSLDRIRLGLAALKATPSR